METRQPLYLALDQGGGSSRALVLDAEGRVLARARVAVATGHPTPGRVEQDPHDLVASLRQAAGEALSTLPTPARQRVAAWGLVCQRASLVCWDRHSHEALTPVISWQDTRAPLTLSPAQCRDLHRLTGLHPSPHHGAGKLRWCLDEYPAVRRAAARETLVMSPLAGYLMAALTGFDQPPAVDPVSAQRTLLWGQARGTWDPALLRRFGLKPAWLPALRPNDADWGLATLGGLALPAHFLGGDQGAALYAEGPPPPGQVQINLGTGAFATLPLAAPHPLPPSLLHSLVLDRGGERCWALEGTVHGAGAALEWLRREHKLHFDEAHLGEWLQGEPRPALFINGVGGLGSPYWRPRLESRFVGPTRTPSRAVAVLESILFLLKVNLDLLAAEAPLARIHFSGGLSRIDGLGQRLADLSGYPVIQGEDAEATARGLGWLLAHQGGDGNRSPRPFCQNEPDKYLPRSDPSLQRRYRRWQCCMATALNRGA